MDITDNTGGMGTGTRATAIIMTMGELVTVICEARWMLLAILACVLADFRYGWGESSKRYNEAKKNGDQLQMIQYKWRTSRAIRRTINKLIDYLIWVSIGVFIGMAVLKPFGVDYMMGGIVATIIAIACEGKSFIGHFFYLHGVLIEEKSIKGFIKAFVVAFAKKKNEDLGEAIEEGFNKLDKEKVNESK